MKQNTPRQRKNCLQNFDLSEHRQILSDLAIHIYHQFITVMEKPLGPAIGILQFKSVYSCVTATSQHKIFVILTMVSTKCTSVITSTRHAGAREFTGDFQHEANRLQETF